MSKQEEASEDATFGFNAAAQETVAATRSKLCKDGTQWATYWTKVKVSAGAAMKMLAHTHSGVEKGMKRTGTPVEVMGFMVGHADTDNPTTIVVTDVLPLPIEGTETSVVASNPEVLSYMVKVTDSIEEYRRDRMVGWYHSHPFDVSIHDHCFLSSTDVQTQLTWQRMEDNDGRPYAAVVVDPLRSLAKGLPVWRAFRTYPFNAPRPPADMCPDKSIVKDKNARQQRWGNAWNAYYELEMELYQCSVAAHGLGILSKKFLWTRMLTTTPMLDPEVRERFAGRVDATAQYLDARNFSAGVKAGETLATEHCQNQVTQVVKSALFNAPSGDVPATDNTTGSGGDSSAGAGAGAGAGSGSGNVDGDGDVAMS